MNKIKRKNYEKPVTEYIEFRYSDIACASQEPESDLDPILPPLGLFKSKSLDPDTDYYQKDGTMFTEDELSDFLNDETPF